MTPKGTGNTSIESWPFWVFRTAAAISRWSNRELLRMWSVERLSIAETRCTAVDLSPADVPADLPRRKQRIKTKTF